MVVPRTIRIPCRANTRVGKIPTGLHVRSRMDGPQPRTKQKADAQIVDHQPADEEVLSLQDSERELIRKALGKHRNKRKYAAEELGISERTLYRKIKEYDLK